MQKQPLIVYIDDEVENLTSFRLNFISYYNVEVFDNPEEFFNYLKEKKNNDISIILTDYRMPKMDGITLLAKVKDILPSTRRIIISAYDDTNILMESINKAQVHKFILKPWDKNYLINILEEQIEFYELTMELNKKYEELKMKNLELLEIKKKLEEENKILKSRKRINISLSHKVIHIDDKIKVVIANPIMQQIYEKIEKLKDFMEILLITGERGVGKKTLVKYIYQNSKKLLNTKKIFIYDSFIYKENIMQEIVKLLNEYRDDSLMIYITNIEEIPKLVQKEIYILLTEKVYYNTKLNLENKIIVFSSVKNIESDLRNFLVEELLYYLLPHHINIPPLRFRKDELPYLINYFIDYYAQLKNEPVKLLDSTFKLLLRYNWPGNIDELKNNIKTAVLLAEKEISSDLFVILPGFLEDQVEVAEFSNSSSENLSTDDFEHSLNFLERIRDFKEGKIPELFYDELVDEFEKLILQIALSKAEGNKAKAANLVNLKTGKFLYKTKYLGL